MTEAGGERERRDRPRIYVTSLSDYNAGRLHGVWLDADQDVQELTDGIQTMLDRSPEQYAEEYAIHDYEGFGCVRLSEYDSLERVTTIATGIAEYGEAFAAWVSIGDDDPTVEGFEQAYRGTWESVERYADDLLADLGAEGYLEQVPAWLRPYVRVDNEAFGRDLVLGGDIAAIDGESGVHIFDQCA
jgi:antirestriction protein